MTDAVPDDVMERAWQAFDKIVAVSDGTPLIKDALDIIARAITDERERCAKIADAHSENPNLKQVGSLTAISIAAGIRGQP